MAKFGFYSALEKISGQWRYERKRARNQSPLRDYFLDAFGRSPMRFRDVGPPWYARRCSGSSPGIHLSCALRFLQRHACGMSHHYLEDRYRLILCDSEIWTWAGLRGDSNQCSFNLFLSSQVVYVIKFFSWVDYWNQDLLIDTKSLNPS
jgi:hypothetical protein